MENSVLTSMFKTMLLIRKFEERVASIYGKGIIPGIVHLYIGEEAVAAGVCANLRDSDMITSTHRGHGHVIAKGAQLDKMMAEIYGKATGYCNGKGGSMHICDPEIGVLGANGIVGGGIPIAVGAGHFIKYKGRDDVVVCFFGDGASNQGSFHESLNMASILNVPVVFVCENNKYGISMCQSRHMKIKDIAQRASAYGMPGEVVDGNDIFATYEAAKTAIDRARSGQGPSLLEMKTYRWHGHSEGDSCCYRTEEELDEWKEQCPIKKAQAYLLKNDIMTREEIEDMENKIEKELDTAVAFSEESPFPEEKELLTNVYYKEIIEG